MLFRLQMGAQIGMPNSSQWRE